MMSAMEAVQDIVTGLPQIDIIYFLLACALVDVAAIVLIRFIKGR